MRYITFGSYRASYDGAFFGESRRGYGREEIYIDELDREYKIYRVKARDFEEWPSEEWNFQDKFPLKSLKSMEVSNREKIDSSQPEISGDEVSPEVEKHIDISNEELE